MTAIRKVDYHYQRQSLTGRDDECGDVGMVMEDDQECFLALVDALGHGKEAHEVAARAEQYLSENHRVPLVKLMQGLHSHLKGTRGAVAAICRLSKESGEIDYVGMGNISVKILGNNNRTLVPRDGIIGYMISSPAELKTALFTGDVLLMTSDGLREHFSLVDYPQLLAGSARQIVSKMMDHFHKKNDDASCIALRYGV